ncbi:MAG: cytochrome C, partial [Kofleriaceae bacterium]
MCLGACGNKPSSTLGESSSIRDLMEARGLDEADVVAALKTYTPSGKMDEYYVFAGGGQSGNVDVIGVPSMRLLKVIGVFTPEPWQGWGYGGEGDKVLEEGNRGAHKL